MFFRHKNVAKSIAKHSKTKWTKKVDKSFGMVDNVHYICKIKLKLKTMNDQEKDLRRQKVVDMHNSGSDIKDIMKATSLSRSGIYKILDSVIKKGEIAPKEPVAKIKLSGKEERFNSFVGYERTNVNQYAHKETGEIVNVAFVKATEPGEFGYFVKVDLANGAKVKSEQNDSEKSTASGN